MTTNNQTSDEAILITTLEDIVKKVPIEDIDRFVSDLKLWVEMMKGIEKIKEQLIEGIKIDHNYTMRWFNNDDENTVKIKLKF